MCGSELCDRWLETDCTGRRHVAGPLASFPFFPHLLLRYHRTNEHRMATGQAPPSAPSKRPFVSLTPTWICIRFRLSSDKSDPVITLDILVFFFFSGNNHPPQVKDQNVSKPVKVQNKSISNLNVGRGFLCPMDVDYVRLADADYVSSTSRFFSPKLWRISTIRHIPTILVVTQPPFAISSLTHRFCWLSLVYHCFRSVTEKWDGIGF